jgi:hypothetical protein
MSSHLAEARTKIFLQKRFGADDDGLPVNNRLLSSSSIGPPVNSADNSAVSERITKLLLGAATTPNTLSTKVAWSPRLLQTAMSMWRDGTITICLSNRQCFISSGIRDSWSFSEHRSGSLRITSGFLDAAEIELYQQRLHDPLAYLYVYSPYILNTQLTTYRLTESILHHVAVSVLNLSYREACFAEHFLNETTKLSSRIQFQLGIEDEASLIRIVRKTNAELMKSLCLNLDIDKEWNKAPETVRQLVIARVVGSQIPITPEVSHWMTFAAKDIGLENFHVSLCLWVFQWASQRLSARRGDSDSGENSCDMIRATAQLHFKPVQSAKPRVSRVRTYLVAVLRSFVIAPKWMLILTGAASEVERELWYFLHGNFLTEALLAILLLLWNICRLVKNLWITTILIYGRPALAKIIRLTLRGAARQLIRDSIMVEFPDRTVSAFAWENLSGKVTLDIFQGAFEKRPGNKEPTSIAIYDGIRLQHRQDPVLGGNANSTYHYPNKRSRIPKYKDVLEPNRSFRSQYDDFGRVVSGTLITSDRTEIEFTYHYRKSPKGNGDILRAHYRHTHSSQRNLSVYWSFGNKEGSEDDDNATPSERVTRVVRGNANKKYTTTYTYQHKHDTRSSTILEEAGRSTPVSSPPEIFEDEVELLTKPTNVHFDHDDLLIYHGNSHVKRMFATVSKEPGSYLKLWYATTALLPFGLSYSSRKVAYQRVPTWRLRAELWKVWLQKKELDAVTACWIDELILRQEPLLRKYWWLRNVGRLSQAKAVLDRDIEKIASGIEIPAEVSQKCTLPIKPADLYTMGLGKDAQQITNRPQDCFQDTEDRISVIFNDVGCWPDAPGGVSNCRRDLVNGQKTIRNHVLAESAHDYGISQFQVEKNIQSLKSLPLWGLDFKTAQHGLIDNLLQAQVDKKSEDTDIKQDILETFIPVLQQFVKGARTKYPSRADLLTYSDTFLTMSTYFEQKDYNKTWSSKEVELAWIQAWLQPYDDDNILDVSELFDMERPTLGDFKEALALYTSYFLIYSVQIPDDCPRVFQSTHHGISSLFGMVLKYRKGTTYALWDHGILWRECCLNISAAQCLLPIPVQAMLLAGIGLAARLAYLHADVLLPCTSVFNP